MKRYCIFVIIIGLFLTNGASLYGVVITVINSNNSGPGSLRAAINEANTNSEDDTIVLPSGLYTTLSGAAAEDENASGDLDIKSNIVIQGAGAANTIIDGNYNDRIFHILSGTVTITGVHITKGTGLGKGGGIKVEPGATVTVGECTLTDNRAISDGEYSTTEGGGAIYTGNAVITINNCTISDNNGGFDIAGMGGGIWIDNGSSNKYAEIRDCLINGNTASSSGTGWGGGLLLKAGTNVNPAVISGNTFEDNIASTAGHGQGGAIYLWKYASITNNLIQNNFAGKDSSTRGEGGGIYLHETGGAALDSNRFLNNISCESGSGYGGAVFTHAGVVCTMINNLIAGNHASSIAGGVYLGTYSGKTVQCTMYNNTLADNNTGAGSEGIWLGSYVALTMKNNIIAGHTKGIDNSIDPSNNTINADTNLFWNDSDPFTGNHPIRQDPLLTAEYKLVENSPAVDSGLAIAGVTDDLEGVSRPQGSGYDIGVYEYASSPSAISLDRMQLNFGARGSNTSGSQWFRVSNSGSGNLNWTATAGQTWIQVSPSTGTNTGTVTVNIDPSGLSAGTHTGSIAITDSLATNSPQTVSVELVVYSSGTTGFPFGEFSTPIHNSTVRSSIPVTGWVLDDIGVSSVKIYRAEGNAQVYIGDGVFVEGARPDVEQAYPGYPFNYQAGWGYMMLTNFLPNGGNGTYTIYARAIDAEGNIVTLGAKTINCDNANAVKPFGAIDTPTQGGTASGRNFINFAWVLTPQPNIIPTDGSTINVIVDGVNIGHPTYNNFRADIALLFPTYNNSNGAVGYFYLDTTAYADGVHTIQWTATDDGGNTDGIGSRYFTIQNTGKSRVAERFSVQRLRFRFEPPRIVATDFGPVGIRKGYGDNDALQKIYPDKKGIITIEIRELDPLEIHFHDLGKTTLNIFPLPIGSTLDRERGVFYWSPGVGFVGYYRFVVISEDQSGSRSKRFFDVHILPKFIREK